jgi:hypothetical protein
MYTKDSEGSRDSNPSNTKEESSSLEEMKFSVCTNIPSIWTLRMMARNN